MYLWNIFKTIIYLEFCFKRCLSEPNTETLPSNLTGVEVNINSSKATNTYDYDKSNGIKTFTAKAGFGFRYVSFGGWCFKPENLLWEAYDQSELAKEVIFYKYFSGSRREVIISLFDGQKLKYVEIDDLRWYNFDLSYAFPVPVNIETRYQTSYYYSYSDGVFKIFVPKSQFVFSSVREGSNWFGKTESIIWKTDNAEEYAHKIIRDGKGFKKIMNNVTIFHVNGSITHMNKSGGSWTKKPFTLNLLKPELLSYSDKNELPSYSFKNESSSFFPLAFPKNMNLQPKYDAGRKGINLNLSMRSVNEQFDIIRTGNIDVYVPKLNFSFTSVKTKVSKDRNKSDIILWDGSIKREYSNKVIVDTNYISSLVIIYLTSGDVIKFYMDEINSWSRLNPHNRMAVVIDVRSVNKYHLYNLYDYQISRSYVAKRDFIFKEILYDEVSVWKSEDAKDMSLRVDLSTIHFPSSTIKIKSINGRVRNFYQFDQGFPWNETNHIPRSVASFAELPKKPYFEPKDYPMDTFPANYTLDHTAFGINKMNDISDFMLSRPIDHINGYKDIGINGFGMKMVDILMWTDNTVYRRLSANIPLLGRPLFSLIHRNNRWNCGFCKDVKSLQTRLKFTNI